MKIGDIYKYCVTTKAGYTILKADPYGFQAELRPNNASVIADISDFKAGQPVDEEEREVR